MSKIKREALIILGMHRSGTSALGGVLARLGAAAPKTQMPATPDNPRGYMESMPLMKFHNDILASAGSKWSDWGKFNLDWVDSVVAKEFRDKLPKLLEEEFDNAHLFLLKDPRICRFFPFWLRACKELGIVVKIIIPLRHPLEVAQSLHARNRFGISRSLLIWLRHVLDAEYTSRNANRCFLHYTDLLEDWRSEVFRISGHLDLNWPRDPSQTEVEIEIDNYLESELRRQRADSKHLDHDGELMSWVRAASQALDQLVNDPDPHNLGRTQVILDGIRAEFDRTSEVYGAAVHEEVTAAESIMKKTASRLREISVKSEQLAQRTDKTENELGASVGKLQAELDATTRASTRALNHAADQISLIDELKAQIVAKDKKLLANEETLSKLALEGSELRGRLSLHDDEMKEGRQLISQLGTRLSGLTDELEGRTECENKLRKDLDAAQQTIRQLEANIMETASRLLTLETDNISLRERESTSSIELALLSKQLLASRDEAKQLLNQIANLSNEHEHVKAHMKSEIEERVAANETLAQQVEDLKSSTSWRITAPMRRLSVAARSLTKHPKSPSPLRNQDRQ